ncbi:MAG: hypothetical protein MAG451_01286 [Anaerolineales bacterium]|nr:hypothetical protein [Anaerolineales bacterium]
MSDEAGSPHTDLTATQKRAAHPDFVLTFSVEALGDRLPFPFPVPQDVPPSPKRHYRSRAEPLRTGHPQIGPPKPFNPSLAPCLPHPWGLASLIPLPLVPGSLDSLRMPIRAPV